MITNYTVGMLVRWWGSIQTVTIVSHEKYFILMQDGVEEWMITLDLWRQRERIRRNFET